MEPAGSLCTLAAQGDSHQLFFHVRNKRSSVLAVFRNVVDVHACLANGFEVGLPWNYACFVKCGRRILQRSKQQKRLIFQEVHVIL
jgi:hypothetical protein